MRSEIANGSHIILLEAQCYWIMKAQLEQLPPVLLPSGCKEFTTFNRVTVLFRSELPFQ